ncbi:MAG TPA: FAD-linked oxidase C-terminal domain-containing protein [Candidatus Methylacidiphilales bacterium]|nr:FAD-linked oxidase C-terminal domain-containing protein [Candidatus Methylacidiphilales bacterium]
MSSPSWFRQLAALFPRGVAVNDPETLASHSGDAWFASSVPEAVVFPRRAGDAATLLRFAHRKRIPVTARGAGRGYVGGCVPKRGGIVVSFARMNRILEINPADSVGVVQPGVITGDFQAQALRHGLLYPPDPASLKECTLGGNVATNAGGPRCLKYGVTRHYVLGLQVALADGTLVRTGGRTQKNKSGFDFTALFTGAEGLLGLVTEITLRLIPAPPARAVLAASFRDARSAASGVQHVLGQGFLPSALELADRFTLEAARRHLGSQHLPPGDAHLLVEIDGQPTSVHAEAHTLADILKAGGALDIILGTTETECESLWGLRREFSASLKATGLTKLNEDICVPRSRLVDLFDFTARLQKKYGIEIASFGHAGDGNIHVNLMADLTLPGVKKKTDRALDELFRQIIAWNGAITGEHGIGLAKLPWWPKAASPELRRLHRLIKKALDPNEILNPGKFV